MNCLECGACCRCLLFPYSGNPEPSFISARGGKFIGRKLVFPNVCKFLDEKTNECKIYENRPVSCWAFQVGGPDCLRCREWAASKHIPL